MNRLNGTSELFDIEIKPKFQLSYETPIFTMGSCFARNVEHHLIQNNANLVLKEFGLPRKFINPEIGWLKNAIAFHGEEEGYRQVSRSSINKYTPHSMLNEFERVLTSLHDHIPDSGIIFEDGKIVDLQVKHTIPQNMDDAIEIRNLVLAASEKVLESECIFLTLGYTETWWDLETGIVANEAPPFWLVKKYPERFEFRVIDEAECFECLQKIYDLLTSKLKTFNLIITVSPVPLGVTFTDQDVIVANMHSKATLRSAVGRFVKDHSNADYFPSFEFAMLSDPNFVWREDRVHVKTEAVDSIIKAFCKSYFSGNP